MGRGRRGSKGHREPRVSRPDPKGAPRWRVRRRWRGLWHAAAVARKGDPPRERTRVACGGGDPALGPGGRGVLPGSGGDGAERVAGCRVARVPSTTPHSRPGPDRSASRSRTPCGSAGTAPAEPSRPPPSPVSPSPRTGRRDGPRSPKTCDNLSRPRLRLPRHGSSTRGPGATDSGSSLDWGHGRTLDRVVRGDDDRCCTSAARPRTAAGTTTPAL
jgi:hypothetical protein